MKRIFLLLTILLSFFLMSCKKEFSFSEDIIEIYLNEEYDIPYKGPKNMEFVSNNDNLSINGTKIKGIKAGFATITSKDEKYKDKKLRVEVKPVFAFQEKSLTIELGKEVGFKYFLLDGYNLSIVIKTDHISYDGSLVKALKEGESGLIATATKGDYTYTVILPIYVVDEKLPLEEIIITGPSEVTLGEAIKLDYELVPNTSDNVIWRTSDESIASVNSDGYVISYKMGVVTITASVGSITASHKVTVLGKTTSDYVDLYYINDLHGAIEREGSSLGLAYIANFVDKRREENPNTLLLAGGDILQGQAMSNYYYGASTLTIMELMGFDAMAIGNHEFDWGLEVVTDKFNPTTGIVSFPLLGINVRKKATNQIPENILPYVMIEKANFRVGVIGVIGEYLESSIASNKVKDYEFISSINLIKDASKTLRNNGADFVIVIIHDDNDTLNHNIASLVGIERIDAIFNAHSHAVYETNILGKPVIQSRHNGEYVGHIRLYKDGSFNYENIKSHPDLETPLKTVENQIEIYKAETDPIFTKLIIKNRNMTTDRNELSSWIAKLMRTKTGADIGFQNYGGTRSYISANENITLKKLYQIWPFDNVIKTVKLKGSYVKILMDNSSLAYDTDVVIEDDKEYVVATNDYIFDFEGNQYIFNQGTNHTNTGILLRDLAEEELTRQSKIYDYFDPSNPLITTYFFKEEYIYLYL